MSINEEMVEEWGGELRVVQARIGRYFERQEARERAMRYLKGLLSDVPRKNGWQLAEQAGEATPDGMQRLLSTAVWDGDAVRDELGRYIVENLGEADASLVVDETGFPKQGKHSAGVKRQYSGTLGKVANCQIGVFLTVGAVMPCSTENCTCRKTGPTTEHAARRLAFPRRRHLRPSRNWRAG